MALKNAAAFEAAMQDPYWRDLLNQEAKRMREAEEDVPTEETE
jgi:hypothetical protein